MGDDEEREELILLPTVPRHAVTDEMVADALEEDPTVDLLDDELFEGKPQEISEEPWSPVVSKTVVRDLLALADQAGWDTTSVIWWLSGPNGRIGGRRPFEILGSDPEKLLEIASFAFDGDV